MVINSQRTKLTSFFIPCLWIGFFISTGTAQTDFTVKTVPIIQSVQIQSKVNGLLISIRASNSVPGKNLTGWQADNHWFYLTLFQCQADSAALVQSFKASDEVRKIDVLNSNESTQIAFELSDKVEDFEFQTNGSHNVYLALRFPRQEVLAALESETKTGPKAPNESSTVSSEQADSPFYLRLRSAAYLVGISLTVTGILANDNTDRTGWELPAGVAVTGLTYVYDHYIHKRLSNHE